MFLEDLVTVSTQSETDLSVFAIRLSEEFQRKTLWSSKGVFGNPAQTVLLRRFKHESGVDWHETSVRKREKTARDEKSRRGRKSKARTRYHRRASRGSVCSLIFSNASIHEPI